MTPVIKQPPADCPNGEICIEDEVQRRRSSDRGEWVRWAVGLALGGLFVLMGWAFGRLGSHETRLGVNETEINTLKASDVQIHSQLTENKNDYSLRLTRIENKQDEILMMLSRRR